MQAFVTLKKSTVHLKTIATRTTHNTHVTLTRATMGEDRSNYRGTSTTAQPATGSASTASTTLRSSPPIESSPSRLPSGIGWTIAITSLFPAKVLGLRFGPSTANSNVTGRTLTRLAPVSGIIPNIATNFRLIQGTTWDVDINIF